MRFAIYMNGAGKTGGLLRWRSFPKYLLPPRGWMSQVFMKSGGSKITDCGLRISDWKTALSIVIAIKEVQKIRNP